MYQVLSICYIALIYIFMAMYIVCFVMNIVRANKVNKELKKEDGLKSVKGKVIEIIKDRKKYFVRVEYVSATNGVKFVDYFEMTETEFNDQYYVDQEVEIYYPEVSNWKKVTYFPVYLEGQPIKVKKSALITDGMFAGVGIFMAIWITTTAILTKARFGLPLFNEVNMANQSMANCSAGSPLTLLLPFVLYMFTIPYMIERFTMADKDQNHSYLKLCGIRCMAEVKTFKFSRSKNEKGIKESLLQIEFYNNKGELIKANVNSYMYTETQEQYVNILYDIKNPKNVVYMRK